jgi:hypothetical protein
LKLKTVLEFRGVLGVVGKPVEKSDLIEFISEFSELRCGRYCFLSGFCWWTLKRIAKKLGLK